MDVSERAEALNACAQDSGPSMPILVFLSPGVDVAASVEALGRKLGFTKENGNFAVVSLGQVGPPTSLRMTLSICHVRAVHTPPEPPHKNVTAGDRDKSP